MNGSSRWANASSTVAPRLVDTFSADESGASRSVRAAGAVYFWITPPESCGTGSVHTEKGPISGQPILPIRAGPLGTALTAALDKVLGALF
jgi:hypothetical protein